MDNKKIRREWIQSSQVLSEHKEIEVRQVSAWIVTIDNNVVLISKNGDKWTIPGGHPESGEDNNASLEREVLEESGVNIQHLSKDLLGYYVIEESEGQVSESFLQLRYLVRLTSLVDETFQPSSNDEVKFVNKFNPGDVINHVKWAKDSDDYKLLLHKLDETE